MLTAAIISGLGLGSMYALLALGFHITYVVSRTVNFAQGSAMMIGAVKAPLPLEPALRVSTTQAISPRYL